MAHEMDTGMKRVQSLVARQADCETRLLSVCKQSQKTLGNCLVSKVPQFWKFPN